jgi:hypothetical protein
MTTPGAERSGHLKPVDEQGLKQFRVPVIMMSVQAQDGFRGHEKGFRKLRGSSYSP